MCRSSSTTSIFISLLPPLISFLIHYIIQWYKYPENASCARLAFYLDTPFVLFYNPVCYGKAESGTCLFCSKKRIKNKRKASLGYTPACIFYLEHRSIIFNVCFHKYCTIAAHSLNRI